MNDRVLSGNFHTHIYKYSTPSFSFFIRPLRPVRRPSPFPKTFDFSPLSLPRCSSLRRITGNHTAASTAAGSPETSLLPSSFFHGSLSPSGGVSDELNGVLTAEMVSFTIFFCSRYFSFHICFPHSSFFLPVHSLFSLHSCGEEDRFRRRRSSGQMW